VPRTSTAAARLTLDNSNATVSGLAAGTRLIEAFASTTDGQVIPGGLRPLSSGARYDTVIGADVPGDGGMLPNRG